MASMFFSHGRVQWCEGCRSSVSAATMLPAVPPCMVPRVRTALSRGEMQLVYQGLPGCFDSSSHDNGIHSRIRIGAVAALSVDLYVNLIGGRHLKSP